jgi:hypothetical protein
MGSAVLTSQDVAREVERLATESAFGYVHVIVAGGRIERIDSCRQIKATGIAAKAPRTVTAQVAAEPN